MSLEWCTEHCPRTHHPKGAQASHTVGRPYWCPIFPDFMGACFQHCNLDSEQVCGDCVHWYGQITFEGNRHSKYGNCPYVIGGVGSKWHNDCPHYHARPKNFDETFPDWIERQIKERGFNPASPQARSIRKEVRKQWFKIWE